MPEEQEYYKVHPEVLKAFAEWQAENSLSNLAIERRPRVMTEILINLISFIICVCGIWQIIDILVWIVEKIF